MTNHLIISTVGLIAAVTLANPVWGFDIERTRTSAEIVLFPPDPLTPAIALTFRAQLLDARSVDPTEDVGVNWEQFGGIEPQPFNILIPAGCFVPNRGFHVENFRRCGVEITVDFGRGPIALSIREFQARFLPPNSTRDRPARLDIKTVFTDDGRESDILGTVGASAVEIFFGEESAASLMNSMEAVSGPQPQPF